MWNYILISYVLGAIAIGWSVWLHHDKEDGWHLDDTLLVLFMVMFWPVAVIILSVAKIRGEITNKI